MDETTGSPDIVDVAAANPAVGRTVDGTALMNALTATAAPVWPRWSVRRWLVTIGVAVGIALSIVVFSNAPWWTGLILGVCLPAALFGTEAQRNLEWVGYHRCPTCSGSGKVRDV